MENGFDINKFNDFLNIASEQLACDAECQKQKQSTQLYQNYINAQANVRTAPSELNEAKQKWITFSQGNGAYRKMQTSDFTQEAQKALAEILTHFNEEVVDVSNNIVTYSGVLNNCSNVYDLYIKYKDENEELKKSLTNDDADVNTNNRKTYYENQQLEMQQHIYRPLLFVYIVVVICYVVSMTLYTSSFDLRIQIGILIMLVVLPFISSYLLSGIIWIFQKIYYILPKNVYMNL